MAQSFPSTNRCLKRGTLQVMDREGQTTERTVCRHTGCERFTLDVDAAYCGECPLRQSPALVHLPSATPVQRSFGQPKLLADGSLVYPKTGWEPPPPHPGYKPKPDDPWTFIPTWPACSFREPSNRVKPCGCLDVRMICTSEKSGHLNQRVTPAICSACPLRHHVHDEEGPVDLSLSQGVVEGVVRPCVDDAELGAQGS